MPPDVVIVLIDTLRPDHLGLYGYPAQTAPFLAGVAKSAVIFDKCFTTASRTAPATASLFTSLYPTQHGVIEGIRANERKIRHMEQTGRSVVSVAKIPDSVPTLPELFRRKGYRTFGIATNPNIGPEIGFDRGFDRFERIRWGTAEDIFERLVGWENELNDNEPHFVYLHLNDVHAPYERREPWYEKGETALLDTIAAYDSEIGYVDGVLRRIFDRFGWKENAIAVFVSDHGEEFMEHGEIGHRFSLYPELTRIVLMITGPGDSFPPGHVDAGVTLLDLLPTLAELADTETPDGARGHSLLPLLRGEAKKRSRPEEGGERFFFHRARTEPSRELWSVLEDDWLLIRENRTFRLFDVAGDPFAQVDVAAENRARVRRLSKRIDRFREKTVPIEGGRGEFILDEKTVEELKSLGYVQ